MALIAMAVHDTEENKRSEYTRQTIDSLINTVDFNRHRLVISDNGSCAESKVLFGMLENYFERFPAGHLTVIKNGTNLGTARAVNKGFALRQPGEYLIKMDNDVVIHQAGWVDQMEETIMRKSTIGILGLKRKDLAQSPWSNNPVFRSTLEMVEHEKGQRWMVIEHAKDIMGTCTMFNHLLVDIIGGLRQPGVYGWDDVDYCLRSLRAGFENCFLPHIEIDHIDTGGDAYCTWKQQEAKATGEQRKQWERGYVDGSMTLYQPFE